MLRIATLLCGLAAVSLFLISAAWLAGPILYYAIVGEPFISVERGFAGFLGAVISGLAFLGLTAILVDLQD